MRTYLPLAFVWVLLVQLCPAQTGAKPAEPKRPADVLVFTNGDTLTGKLQSASGGNVLFHSDMAGDLTIPFSKVKELRSGSEFVALRAAKPGRFKPEGTGTVTFIDDKLVLTPNAAAPNAAAANAPPTTLPTKDLGYLIDVPTYSREIGHEGGFKQGWNGSATGGFTLVRSTESSTTFTAALNLVQQTPTVPYLPADHRTTVNVTETFGTNTSPVIPPTTPFSPAVTVKTSIFHADGEYDKYFSPRLFALVDTSFDHNFASGLQVQQTYGVGIGFTPWKDARQELDLKAEVHFEKQQFLSTAGAAPPANTTLIGSTFQENYRRSLPRKIVFTEWANYLPAWNNAVAYSANAYMGLALPLYKRLNVSLSATDNYLNNPAQYYKPNTVQFVTGVTYAFK